MADEEALQPYGYYVGGRPEQIPLVFDDQGLVHHP